MRKRSGHDARKAREKAIKDQTGRLERAGEEERTKRRRAREKLRAVEVRESYEKRWKALAPSSAAPTDPPLGLADIPWPIHLACTGKDHIPFRVDNLTVDAVSTFLLPSSAEDDRDPEVSRKECREWLRNAMLRFHPDKCEGQVTPRVRADERDTVREAVGFMARTLNMLMAQTK